MDGDFSKWFFDQNDNFNGVLQQQGKVLLDPDWNAQTQITNHWQDTAGRDVIGAGVAAVPADAPNAFKVTKAAVGGDKVTVTLLPGRIWADGLLVYLGGETEVSRIATYLQPPIQVPAFDETTIDSGARDAVVLEVWREAINGFQVPETLIEPALGGPDTTERVHTAMALRLFRLADGETCESIRGKLQDDFASKGKLTVSLQPTNVIPGDCPVVEGGGYTGFEHHLYRIEIAQVNSGTAPMFKWSQFNGGLVGQGIFSATTQRVTITANLQAIATSGLDEFYLEAVEYESPSPPATDVGHWKVTYGAKVTLNNDNELELPTTPMFGAIPAPNPVFFRLWNDIREISDFPIDPNPTDLGDGIRLEFEPSAAANYVPGDYWTFPVRAGEIGNPPTLINAQSPEGIHYHRVPLAVLNWDGNPSEITFAAGKIEDCRHPFQPLTRLGNCCTYSVGDGIQSHGNFDSIQEAVNHLPATGGQICVLPGVYTENVLIDRKVNITIRGCGKRSQIISQPPTGEFSTADPVIHVKTSQHIHIESLAITADNTGIGILLEDSPTDQNLPEDVAAQRRILLREVTLADLHIKAATQSAIAVHHGQFIAIRNCHIDMKDVTSSWPGVFFVGEDALIEDNVIQVQPEQQVPATPDRPPVSILRETPGVPLEAILDIPLGFVAGMPLQAVAGLGGLQIGGTSERVRILNNLIQGGIGNGITLGSIAVLDEAGSDTGIFIGWVVNADDPCNPCKPGSTHIPPNRDEDDGTSQVPAGALYEIYIERNRIFDMGLNGIGVIGFFSLDAVDEFISIKRLSILDNEIRQCLQRPLKDIPPNMIDSMGYGGITLADVEYLVIRDNVIEDNGPSQLEPICGIFILHGEGIEIDHNRILNNGAKQSEQSANEAKDGRRGGINVVFGIAPTVPITVLRRQDLLSQNGVPAIKIHDNIVSVPLGQALSLTALGPVSVVGNQFTSRGMILKFRPLPPSFIASTVAILNLGLSNELYGQLLAFSTFRNGQLGQIAVPTVSNDVVVIPQRGLDDLRIGQYLANGNILFSNNQCVLDLLETGLSLSLSSIFIASLDDIGFHNNQCDCSLLDDFVLSQAILFGFSVRVSDSRFKEGILNSLFSAVTLGILNMTTDNQATHCLLIRGGANMVVDQPNTVLLELFSREICGRFGSNTLSTFGRG